MMRQLTSGFFDQSPVLLFPIVALCLFMGVFVLVTVRTLRTRKTAFDDVAALPLDDGDCGEPKEGQL